MTLQQIWTVFAFSGAVTLLLASGVLWLREKGIRPVRDLLQRYAKLKRLAQIFIALFVAQFFVYGSTKTSGGGGDDDDTPDDPPATTNAPPVNWPTDGTNAPPLDWPDDGTNAPPLGGLMMCAPRRFAAPPVESITGFTDEQIAAEAAFVSTRTNEVWDFSPPDGATIVERWKKHGAARQRLPLGCEHPLDGPMMIDTFGRLTTEHRTFAPLGVQVGMVPEANWAKIGRESLAWWMVTASNTSVVCWQNALLNRDTNTPVSVQAEFFDNGRFEYRYDLSAAGADATNIVARVSTTNGEETVRLDAGVTSVRGWLLGPEDGHTLDKDGDGISTYDEIFIHGTDPELPDSDGDGKPDGEEIRSSEDDPLVSDVSNAAILARIAGGATNETFEIVEGVLESTILWDGFAIHSDVGTNALFTRTFAVDRKNGWTSYFLSGRGEAWCADGADAIGEWKLYGAVLEWSDDTGASGTLTASPLNDSLHLPVARDAASVTITLRASAGGGRHASPQPIFFLAHTPRLEFPGGQEIEDDNGNHYSVFTDIDDFALTVDNSDRPCHAATFEGEATEADFPVPTEPGVYNLPFGTMAEPDERPRLMMAAPQNNGSAAAKQYLVILDPWVAYGAGHYGCCHAYPYDQDWFGYWCDCMPECHCGVAGIAAVNAYIDWYDDYEAEGVVKVAGREVWRDTAYHIVWPCDHTNGNEDERYCPCGCDSDCEHCSCVNADGPSQGSIRFRVNLGANGNDQMMGFAWFESEGPVTITPDTFTVTTRPDANVSVSESGSSVCVTTYETGGRDLAISALTNGVIVAVKHHGASMAFETWEITNVENSPSVVRLVKRGAAETAPPQGGTTSGQQQEEVGAIREDWTYSCSWQSGEWVWDVADNRTFDPPPRGESVEVIDGTNFVFGSDGQLQRVTIETNGEEVVVRTISYDDDGRIVLVDDGTNGCVTIAYDAAGNVSEMTGPEGTLRAAWDENGVMTNLDTSAWNGPTPNANPPLMAPRPRLLGAGGGITVSEAIQHYLHGNGSPITLPFSVVDTSSATPIKFDCVRNFVSCCHVPNDYHVVGTNSFPAIGKPRLVLGDVPVKIDGTITYTGQCNWTFHGTMSGAEDPYDFNAGNRGLLGEALTALGRALYDGRGTHYVFQFSGSVPLDGSGHCGDR